MLNAYNKIIPQVLSGVTVLLIVGGLIFPLFKVTIGTDNTFITASNINEDNKLFTTVASHNVQENLFLALILSLIVLGLVMLPNQHDYFKYSGFVSLGTAMFTYFAFAEIIDYKSNDLEFIFSLLSIFEDVSVSNGIGYLSIFGALISSLAYSVYVLYRQYWVNDKSQSN